MIEIPTAIFWTVLIGLLAYGIWKSVESESNKDEMEIWRSKYYYNNEKLNDELNYYKNETSRLNKELRKLSEDNEIDNQIKYGNKINSLEFKVLFLEKENAELKSKLSKPVYLSFNLDSLEYHKNPVKTSGKFKAKVKSALRDIENEKRQQRI